jgi:hypothetical protein
MKVVSYTDTMVNDLDLVLPLATQTISANSFSLILHHNAWVHVKQLHTHRDAGHHFLLPSTFIKHLSPLGEPGEIRHIFLYIWELRLLLILGEHRVA